MDRTRLIAAAGLIVSCAFVSSLNAQIKTKNAQSWELTGRVQMQNLIDTDRASTDSRTSNGFRIRRGRLQAKGKLTDQVETKFQIEVRDNSPRLKDAEGKVKLPSNLYVRFGQFKVPVWREEFQRSSGGLLLVERSAVAGFLDDIRMSARHIGFEFGKKLSDGVGFAVNFSNGAGEGVREDAGRSKSDFVNNGKMVSGRLDVELNKNLQVGVSGAANKVGNELTSGDNSGTITVIAPDAALSIEAGEGATIDIEGGAAFGSIDQAFAETTSDVSFTLFDVTGRWKKKLAKANADIGGLDAVEIAAGFSSVDADNGEKFTVLRFGPAVYFGKQTRLQVNGEVESPDVGDSVFKVRSQITFNF